MTDIADALRATAQGMYPTEAGVELLIRHGKAVYDGAPWITRHGDDRASIDVDKLLYETGVWSSGEQRIVRIAVSLLDGPPVDLSDVFSGLDRVHLDLVLAAIAHAGGSHEHSPPPFLIGDDGKPRLNPDRAQRLSSLHPWPDAG